MISSPSVWKNSKIPLPQHEGFPPYIPSQPLVIIASPFTQGGIRPSFSRRIMGFGPRGLGCFSKYEPIFSFFLSISTDRLFVSPSFARRKAMASAGPRSYGQRGSFRNQQRYVPKSKNADASSASPSSRDPSVPNNSNPPPPLTTALRGSSPAASRPVSKEKRSIGAANFVNYLPQDEAVASGLGADAGGLDAEESQAVVDLLNNQLSRILKLSPRDFWKEVATNDSLHEFLDSYLQFRNRWYDFPYRGSRGTVAGVIIGELELCRRVFMILYRISSNKDPGAPASESLSMKDHTALLQEKKLLDLPKLLDICAIYGHENEELTRSLILNAMKAQPSLSESINAVISHFLSIVHTMHERCSSSLEVLVSSGGHEDNGQGQLYKDFLEVMDFINDAIVTLDAFADAYRPAALYFCTSFEMSYGNEELLNMLARLHDFLLPSLQQGLTLVSNTRADGPQSGDVLSNIVISVKMLSMRMIKFGWKLLDFCYLNDEFIEESLLQTAAKMFPAMVEDPAIRGDILIETLKEINGKLPSHLQENHNGGTFIQNVENNYKLLSRIGNLRNKGWIFMDEDQFQYICQIATALHSKSLEKGSGVPISSMNEKVHAVEDAAIMESKISQIKDLFPDYGKGFLSACLEVYDQNTEEVIQRILEGTLHEDLLSLDTSLEHILPSKSASRIRSDKGKGILLESASLNGGLPAKVDLVTGDRHANGPSSTSSPSFGRYTRKSKDELPDTEVLDSRTAKNAIKSAVLAAEHEYEDEYDDSYDDLGLSVVESGYEEAEIMSDRISSLPGKSLGSEVDGSSRNSSSRWSSQKKPQFYVKDGKNYSYKVSGSVAVSNAQAAAIVNQAQKEVIHGLGRGGNIPLGAVKQLMDAEEQDNQTPDGAENVGRGSSNYRGRGGRRGGGNYHRKDRAMKKHFSGLGGY